MALALLAGLGAPARFAEEPQPAISRVGASDAAEGIIKSGQNGKK